MSSNFKITLIVILSIFAFYKFPLLLNTEVQLTTPTSSAPIVSTEFKESEVKLLNTIKGLERTILRLKNINEEAAMESALKERSTPLIHRHKLISIKTRERVTCSNKELSLIATWANLIELFGKKFDLNSLYKREAIQDLSLFTSQSSLMELFGKNLDKNEDFAELAVSENSGISNEYWLFFSHMDKVLTHLENEINWKASLLSIFSGNDNLEDKYLRAFDNNLILPTVSCLNNNVLSQISTSNGNSLHLSQYNFDLWASGFWLRRSLDGSIDKIKYLLRTLISFKPNKSYEGTNQFTVESTLPNSKISKFQSKIKFLYGKARLNQKFTDQKFYIVPTGTAGTSDINLLYSQDHLGNFKKSIAKKHLFEDYSSTDKSQLNGLKSFSHQIKGGVGPIFYLNKEHITSGNLRNIHSSFWEKSKTQALAKISTTTNGIHISNICNGTSTFSIEGYGYIKTPKEKGPRLMSVLETCHISKNKKQYFLHILNSSERSDSGYSLISTNKINADNVSMIRHLSDFDQDSEFEVILTISTIAFSRTSLYEITSFGLQRVIEFETTDDEGSEDLQPAGNHNLGMLTQAK